MVAYLKIENPGIAPPESFTLLGASTKRHTSNQSVIGVYGSGSKFGISTLLRHDISPIVFAGNLKMSFSTKPVNVNDGNGNHEFNQIQVKYGGKDINGQTRSSTEDLGFVLEYGCNDWINIDLALREFVSNSIDRAIEEGEVNFKKYYQGDDDIYDALDTYRKTAMDFQRVVVEVVNENQVRASNGTTRVFIPLTEEVFKFYNNLGKWFLHFSEPASLKQTILEKKNRNLSDRKAAVIYRRGVRVREFESSEIPSLFDYNLDNLEMDESRKVDDWKVKHASAVAIRDASINQLTSLFDSFSSTKKYWEHGFDFYGLQNNYCDNKETVDNRQTKWQKAFNAITDENTVIAKEGSGDKIIRKGYKVLVAPEGFVDAAKQNGIATPDKILSQDEREGREIFDASPEAIKATDFVWEKIVKYGMTNGKQKPKVFCFKQQMQSESITFGFQRGDVIYFNENIVSADMTTQFIAMVIEEIVHFLSGATDRSQDLQNFAFNFIAKMMLEQTKPPMEMVFDIEKQNN